MAEKVLVTLVCKETQRQKKGLIAAGFGLPAGQTWQPGAQVKVPKNWFDSIPSSTEYEAYKQEQALPPAYCPHCGGTGREVSGEIFADYSEGLDVAGQVSANTEDEIKQLLNNPQLAQQAENRERERRPKSPDKTCRHCKGSGRPGII